MHALAKEYKTLELDQVIELLRSAVHEDRLLALLILVRRASKAERSAKKEICDLYLAHTRFVNNWDLVDASAPTIVGGHLRGQEPQAAGSARRLQDHLGAPYQHHRNASLHSPG